MINDEEYDKPARQGDVGGVAIQLVSAIRTMQVALLKIRAGQANDIGPQIEKLEEIGDTLDGIFERLVGWKKS